MHMKSANWKDIAELVGIAAIVGSLIFVGLEMRLTRSIALAETYQTRTDSEMYLMSFNAQPDNRQLWLKVINDEPLSADDAYLLWSQLYMRFVYLENLHFQMEIGMISRELWNRNLHSLIDFFSLPKFVEWWESNSDNFRPTFSSDIDEFLGSIDRETVESE